LEKANIVRVEERIFLIERQFGHLVQSLEVLENYGDYFKIKITFKDESVLRMTESWRNDVLLSYSYYWLTGSNELIVGWDNAPHHKKVKTFPHHKHLAHQKTIRLSYETSLEDVMREIEKQLKDN